MKISVHILPRRTILFLILILAWGLRLWGLSWGPEQSRAYYPDEWTWQVIERLSWSHPTYQGIWTQTFFSLAACVREAISTLVGWLGVWLGEMRTSDELAVPGRLAGRLTVAFLGGGQVWVAYMVGCRFFDSVATGLLAAAVLAVSPLLVSQSHYLLLDVPLGLAVMLCLWTAWRMVTRPGLTSLFLAGLTLGLTLTTKATGILVLPVLLGAYVIVLRHQTPTAKQAVLYWPGTFLAGVLLGLGLGYPGFIVRLPEISDVLSAYCSTPNTPGGERWGYLASRWQANLTVLRKAVGLELLALWLVALALMIWRRQWPRLLLMIFPPIYFLAGLTTLKGPVEGQQAVWLPLATLAACWPLVVVCRRLPGRWWPVMGICLFGCLLCMGPLWRSLGLGYLFWQQDTLAIARFWLKANLPPLALVLTNPNGPLNLFPRSQPLPADPEKLPPFRGQEEPSYLVLTSLDADGNPSVLDPAWRQWSQDHEMIKRFDLRNGYGLGTGGEGPAFPRWVSPKVEVYVNQVPSPIRQPLALWRPAVGVERSYAVIITDQQAYSRAENVMWLNPGNLAQRVLRSQKAMGELSLLLDNQGQDLAVVEVRQGFLSRRLLTIYPGQEQELSLQPLTWPMMTKGFYPVRLVLRRGGNLLARLDWDPLLLGRRALETGHYARAVPLLQRAVAEQGGGFDALALLAGAQARLGQLKEAACSLAKLSGTEGEPARAYIALADQEQPNSLAQWLERLGRLTGYHTSLLRQATSHAYLLQWPLCQSEGQEVPLDGAGYHGSFLRYPGKPGGHIKVWLDTSLPNGQFQMNLKLTSKSAPTASLIAQVEVWGHSYGGSQLLASRRLNGVDLPSGQGILSLPVSIEQAGTKLEVRLTFFSTLDLRLQEVVVGMDLAAHMRHMLRWYYDASGRVALQANHFSAAVAAFEVLLSLDPGFNEAYLPLAQALTDSGRLEQAYQRVRQAEDIFFSQPEYLARVRDLYQVLRREADLARVGKRLRDLRPSLKREARFTNGLTLLGYDQGQRTLQRGEPVDLSYYWRVWAKTPLNYYIFVHLKGPDYIISFDHLLAHGRQPMPSLAPGSVVRENYRLTIPANVPPGRYRLLVGMWDPYFTNSRVQVAEGEGRGGDEVTLTTVQIN